MIFAFFFLSYVCCETIIKIATCNVVNGEPEIKEISNDQNNQYDATVWANFTDSLNETGWYQYHSHGKPGVNSEDIMLCTGALEGYLSAYRIHQHFKLIFDMQEWKMENGYPPALESFLWKNLNFSRSAAASYLDSEFWRTISLILKQFDGLVKGYQLAYPDQDSPNYMSELDLWFLQAAGDIEDVLSVYPNDEQIDSGSNPGPTLSRKRKEKVTPGEHCSGLIRLLPDYSDIFFAHDAWSDYRELHGELKEYEIPIPEFKAHRITMSTRIGKLSSYDDFYINDQGLFVLETTINNFNEDLYQHVQPQCLFTWIRAVHATWTTDNGKNWTETFIKYNSGTYNNQYLVLDSKHFEPKSKPTKDLLWIIEQLPGNHMSQDVTQYLLDDLFFPSFNTPWFEELYELGGYPKHVAEWGEDGDYWTYNTSARYYLFYREVPRIKTFEEFQKFMRYNNWKRDLYSNGDPGQMILSRYDQRPGYNPHFPRREFGGLDSKCLKLSEAKLGSRMQFHARASPTFDEENGIPKYRFPDNYPHDGLPDEWDFDWIIFKSDVPDVCSNFTSKKSCVNVDGCGWCIYSSTCFPGNSDGPYYDEICSEGWTYKQEDKPWATPVIVTICILVILFTSIVYTTHFYTQCKNKKSIL